MGGGDTLMAKVKQSVSGHKPHVKLHKRTSQGGKVKRQTMNKHKKRSFKNYRGQGH